MTELKYGKEKELSDQVLDLQNPYLKGDSQELLSQPKVALWSGVGCMLLLTMKIQWPACNSPLWRQTVIFVFQSLSHVQHILITL